MTRPSRFTPNYPAPRRCAAFDTHQVHTWLMRAAWLVYVRGNPLASVVPAQPEELRHAVEQLRFEMTRARKQYKHAARWDRLHGHRSTTCGACKTMGRGPWQDTRRYVRTAQTFLTRHNL